MTTPQLITTDTAFESPLKVRDLDDSIRVLQDGVRGYRTAAEQVSNTILATRLRDLAKSRERVLAFLMAAASESSRVSPEEESGSITGALHRGWMKLKAAFTDDDAIIEAAKTGEAEAFSTLETALAKDFDPKVEEALRRAMLDVEAAMKQLDGLTG